MEYTCKQDKLFLDHEQSMLSCIPLGGPIVYQPITVKRFTKHTSQKIWALFGMSASVLLEEEPTYH